MGEPELWKAINAYAETCGGDASEVTVSERRMNAVVAVCTALEGFEHRAWPAERARLAAELAQRDERVRELEAELSAWRSGSDLGHQRIEQLERELAEARQREEDATDLILRQGRELAALRPKAEAAERRAAALRAAEQHYYSTALVGAAWTGRTDELRRALWATDPDILAACPEKGGAG